MSEWVQLGDGECDEPWYRELGKGEVQLCADGCQVSDAIGFQYAELDRLPRYASLIEERDEALRRVAFFERNVIEAWKTEESVWLELESALIAERDALRTTLLDIEWVSLRDSWLRCPWCGRKKSEGHAENCMRRLALKEPPDDHV